MCYLDLKNIQFIHNNKNKTKNSNIGLAQIKKGQKSSFFFYVK